MSAVADDTAPAGGSTPSDQPLLTPVLALEGVSAGYG